MGRRKVKKQKRAHYSYRVVVYLALAFLAVFIAVFLWQTKLQFLSKAQQNGFHLTQELYGSNTADALSFNIHVKFNSDGCDGDITLYKDGQLVGGPNGWRGPGEFDYGERYTGSPVIIPNDGQPHAISFRGAVNRCPASPGTLWDDISCTVTFDSGGLPQISPADKCSIKNLSEIAPVPFTSPKVIPTAVLPPTATDIPAQNLPPANQPENPSDTPSSKQPSPTPNTVVLPNSTPTPTVIIQFMGVKLGKLSGTQPLDIFWDLIKKIMGL